MSNAQANHDYTKEWLKGLLEKAKNHLPISGGPPREERLYWEGYQEALEDIVEAWGEYDD